MQTFTDTVVALTGSIDAAWDIAMRMAKEGTLPSPISGGRGGEMPFGFAPDAKDSDVSDPKTVTDFKANSRRHSAVLDSEHSAIARWRIRGGRVQPPHFTVGRSTI